MSARTRWTALGVSVRAALVARILGAAREGFGGRGGSTGVRDGDIGAASGTTTGGWFGRDGEVMSKYDEAPRRWCKGCRGGSLGRDEDATACEKTERNTWLDVVAIVKGKI